MDFLLADFQGAAVWMWLAFIAIVIALLALDLGVLHKQNREIGVKEATSLRLLYYTWPAVRGGFVWYQFGEQATSNI